MAGDLDFSVQLRLLNDNFNQGVNQARDRFGQLTQSIERNLAQMATDTERAQTLLTGLGNVSSDRLTAELRATADQLRQMGAGANLSGEQIDAAMRTAAQHVIRLGRELEVARQEAVRLSQTNASPAELTEAANRVNRLEQELRAAQGASTTLSNELAGAMNRASNSADAARNAIYRMANIRVPETIRAEIDSISRALVDFQNNSGRPAAEIERATRAAEEQIRRLERELNGADDTIRRTDTSTNSLGGGVNKLKGAFGGLQGLLAAAGLGIGVAEIIETADAFKTLEARVKLATGEGAAFVTGFEGVKEIANETFSSIESTGELFARITAAGETLGLAQGEILSVTQTINEAIKLSGGSAASADAAITQLIQGLQSGVVRGEEFNSIMEQAPRLAKAMADGLGVTRGELRAMAQDGKLTSEVVINAVRSQGEAIASEFATLPTTVGDSLQVLKNKLFNFVGEIDGTLNQTSKLAEGISYIGDSLEDLDPAVVSALTDTFENSLGAVVELGKGIRDAYVMLSDLVSALTDSSADANEQVGLLTRSLQGISIITGFIKDGFSAIGIAAEFVVASLYGAMSDLANIASSITFGELSDKYKAMANNLQELSKETWEKGRQDVLDWESAGVKSLDNAAKTSKEGFAEIAADSEAMYNKMVADGDATTEAIEGQLVKMVSDRIKANDNMVSDEDRLLLASKGLQATLGETGEYAITSAEKMQAAYLGVGESFAEVALKGKEAGKSIELSLSEAINKANTKEAVDDIVLSLQAMSNQGLVTGEQMEFGANIAKTRYEEVDRQIQVNIESFAEYAAEAIKKQGGINAGNREAIELELQRAAASKNLGVQISATGDVMITQLDKSTLASKRTKEQIDELAGSVGVGLSKEFLKSSEGLDELIDGFDDLEKAGYDAGGALVGALTEMSDKAKNEVEIEALTARWHELYKEGKITASELAGGLEQVENRANILKEGINGITEAYGFLGLKTREELAKDAKAYTDSYQLVMKEGELTAQQSREVFEKTAKANIAANGGVIDSFTRTQAAALGLTVSLDEQGRLVVEKAGQATKANDNVTTSVGRIKTAYDGISSSAGSAGQAMVQSANNAASAYDKLQQKIKSVKEAMALKNADETLKNLRVYGTEKAPSEGNQFGSKLAVESFLKSAGLSAERAAEEARKLYAKQGTSDGALNVGKLQGVKDGQVMTADQLARFKSASVYLSEIAANAKRDEERRSKYESKLTKDDDSKKSDSGVNSSAESERAIKFAQDKRLYEMSTEAYKKQWEAIKEASKNLSITDKAMLDRDEIPRSMQSMYDALDRLSDSMDNTGNGIGKNMQDTANDKKGGYLFDYLGTPDQVRKMLAAQQPVVPQSALDAIANLSKQPNFDMSKNTGPVKTIDVNFKLGGASASMSMPENQEGALMALLKSLQDSKAIAGY